MISLHLGFEWNILNKCFLVILSFTPVLIDLKYFFDLFRSSCDSTFQRLRFFLSIHISDDSKGENGKIMTFLVSPSFINVQISRNLTIGPDWINRFRRFHSRVHKLWKNHATSTSHAVFAKRWMSIPHVDGSTGPLAGNRNFDWKQLHRKLWPWSEIQYNICGKYN